LDLGLEVRLSRREISVKNLTVHAFERKLYIVRRR
jgi:hypothetical protein